MELERKLADTRMSLQRELADFAGDQSGVPDEMPDEWEGDQPEQELGDSYSRPAAEVWPDDQKAVPASITPHRPAPDVWHDYDEGDPVRDRESEPDSAEERTETIINFGRRSAYRPGRSRRRRVGTGLAALAAVVAVIVATVMMLPGRRASWPASVVAVQREVTNACKSPNVRSEPDQVNLACARSTRQILWVFALMTSAGNPRFVDPKTGRRGLEPITPAQGGALALSLNLHHPYDPLNPMDSLEVAARAINNIIGGATITGSNGKPVVQPGLESSPANCARYTGSPALISRHGFPGICAKTVASRAGEAALVADVYKRWVVGATAKATQDVVVLFENAKDPGNPRVQAILKHLPKCGC